MRYLRTGGGYYINVGCSELIGSGAIGLVQRARHRPASPRPGCELSDGTAIEADLVVLATGYDNQQEGVRRLFGDEVADRVGPIWGFDEHGFMRNMWKRTGQPGFWLMGGGAERVPACTRASWRCRSRRTCSGCRPERPTAERARSP